MDVSKIPFKLEVLLGGTEIPLKAYFELQIGDIIVLDQSVSEGLAVRIGEATPYRATPGLFETHKAVVIDGRVYP